MRALPQDRLQQRRRGARVRQQLPRPAPSRLHYLYWAIPLLLCVSLLGMLAWRQPALSGYLNPPLSRINIEGRVQFVREADLAALLSPAMQQGFFGLNVKAVKASLEQHPWVSSAAVKRVWPDQLVVQIQEEVPIARWGESQLLNQYGEVFAPRELGSLSSLPVLSGPEHSQKLMMERYKELGEMLFPLGLRLQALTLSERGSWEFRLDDGVLVIAGRQQVSERLRRFLAIYDSRIRNDIALIESVDLRYANGIAVKAAPEQVAGVATR